MKNILNPYLENPHSSPRPVGWFITKSNAPNLKIINFATDLHIQKINWRLDILDEELAQVADGNDTDIDGSSGKY